MSRSTKVAIGLAIFVAFTIGGVMGQSITPDPEIIVKTVEVPGAQPTPQIVPGPQPTPEIIVKTIPGPTVYTVPPACHSALDAADDLHQNFADWLSAMADNNLDKADTLSQSTAKLIDAYLAARDECKSEPST
jgi:hypothetical protein